VWARHVGFISQTDSLKIRQNFKNVLDYYTRIYSNWTDGHDDNLGCVCSTEYNKLILPIVQLCFVTTFCAIKFLYCFQD
jgi:hypothetical protein